MLSDTEITVVLQKARQAAADSIAKNMFLAIARGMEGRGIEGVSGADLKQYVRVAPYFHHGLTARSLNNSGSWQTGNNMKFSLTKQDDFTFAVGAQQKNNAILVEEIGFMFSHDTELLVHDEMGFLGECKVYHKAMQDQHVMLDQLLLSQIEEASSASLGADDETSLGSFSWKPGTVKRYQGLYRLPTPALVMPGETLDIEILGLSSTIDGSTDVIEVVPVTAGWEFLKV